MLAILIFIYISNFLKVLKLHTKLGKPIPSTDPVVVGQTKASTTTQSTAKTVTSNTTKAAPVQPAPSAVKKVLATPKITFVGKLLQ
jgi:zinc finger RNA-binding protein